MHVTPVLLIDSQHNHQWPDTAGDIKGTEMSRLIPLVSLNSSLYWLLVDVD